MNKVYYYKQYRKETGRKPKMKGIETDHFKQWRKAHETPMQWATRYIKQNGL